MINLVLIVVFAITTIFAFYLGKRFLFGVITSFYPAIVVYKAFPYIDNVIFFKDTPFQIFLSHLLVYSVIFLPIFFAVQRVTHSSGNRSGLMAVIDSFLLSISIIALSLVLTLHILPARDIYNLNSSMLQFFNSPLGYFLSLAVPLGVIFHLSKRSSY
ncbi:MAG: hypothetical protein V4664_01110 [Patescibacteria group bacterium]